MHVEAAYVVDKIGVDIEHGEKLLENMDKAVLTDDSRLGGLPNQIEPEKVVEIIDHREIDELNEFPNTEVQIEKVGAAATLVAERFKQNDIEISEDSAILLYGGIASNTMNFQASVTTERDVNIAGWLEEQADIPENMVREMFEAKSKIEKPVKEVFLGDWKQIELKGNRIGIAQLEIVDIEKFVEENTETGIRRIKR